MNKSNIGLFNLYIVTVIIVTVYILVTCCKKDCKITWEIYTFENPKLGFNHGTVW